MIKCSRCKNFVEIDDDDYEYEMILIKNKRYGLRYENKMTVKMFVCRNCFESLVDEAEEEYY